jgi:CubicO group peptidase (beta-lactamase class C family)
MLIFHTHSRLLTAACLAGAGLLSACAKDSPLFEVPSQMTDAPASGYEMALDSARLAARKLVRDDNLPGVSVAVGRGSKLVYAEAFGWSDLSSEVLATPQTLYPVGSISKSMTATAAGLLRERGRLDFDVPIQKYLPDFPEKRWPITTGQLMGHIAGVVRSGGMAETLRQCPGSGSRRGRGHADIRAGHSLAVLQLRISAGRRCGRGGSRRTVPDVHGP